MTTSVEKTVSNPNIADRAVAYGMQGFVVDGNDVYAMMEAVGEAAERARRGEGPTLIEAKTYRWLGHSKSDKRAYRTREEEAEWKAKCPIMRFEQYMLKNGFEDDQLKAIYKEAEDYMEEAVNYAMAAPTVSLAEAKSLVYA
jgi:TPP-dependent pyruvate/acetoin dehydrogenase alpha subunit